MKNNILTRTLYFLEDHIDLILGLFFPAWFGIMFVLGGILVLLPDEIAEKVRPQWMDTALAILASLVVFAIIAILRMIRDITEGSLRWPIIFLLAMDIIITFYIFKTSVAMQAKVDNAHITSDLSRISKHLFVYEEEHGSYPPQQDMKSLLEMLGMNDSDFVKTRFYDIYSAEYHAPAEDSNDPEDRLITMHVKWHLFEGYDHLLFLRREGTVGTEYLKDTR